MLLSWWVPVITGLAAFLGVIVGQFWQGRRDKARWKQETERWQAEREDQRQKDRDTWAREDRYRFVEYKRELYAELLTHLELFRVRMYGSIARLSPNPPRHSGGGVVGPTNHEIFSPQSVREMHVANARLKLVAPGKLSDLADNYIAVLTEAAGMLMVERLEDAEDIKTLYDQVAKAKVWMEPTKLDPLRVMMRADLGEIPTPAE